MNYFKTFFKKKQNRKSALIVGSIFIYPAACLVAELISPSAKTSVAANKQESLIQVAQQEAVAQANELNEISAARQEPIIEIAALPMIETAAPPAEAPSAIQTPSIAQATPLKPPGAPALPSHKAKTAHQVVPPAIQIPSSQAAHVNPPSTPALLVEKEQTIASVQHPQVAVPKNTLPTELLNTISSSSDPQVVYVVYKNSDECCEETLPECCPDFLNPELGADYIYISHIEGGGVGYDKGYTTLGVWLANQSVWSCNYQGFLDAKVNVFNNAKIATNLGAGGRYISYDWNMIFGANIYYDYRKDWRSYNQIGVGLEFLSCNFDFRINGYIPVGRRDGVHDRETFTFPGGFFACSSKVKRSLGGADAEVSGALSHWCPCSCFDIWAGAGLYYYNRECRKALIGGRARLGVSFWDYIVIEGRVSVDNVFDDRYQGFIQFNLPIGRTYCYTAPGRCSPDHMREIALEPVWREDIIVLDKEKTEWDSNF